MVERYLLDSRKREIIQDGETYTLWDIIFYNISLDKVEKIQRVEVDMDEFYNTDIEEEDDSELRAEVSSGDVEETVQ